MRMIFVMVMVIMSKVPFWKLPDISYFQSSQQLQSTLTTAFERHLSVKNFIRTWINIRLCFSWVNIMKRKCAKMCEGTWEIISCTKSWDCSLNNIYQDISLNIFFLFFTETNLVFKSNLLLIEYFSPQFVYLFTFWYSVYLGVHPVPQSFFY